MADTPEILKGIPVPIPNHGPGSSAKYPWDSMEVGDSFVAVCPEGKRKVAHTGNMSALSTRHAKRLGFKFVTRKMGDGNIGVWRVS